MPRSEPGKGLPVLLVLLGDADHAGPGEGRAPDGHRHHSLMSARIGEDYSTCEWPVAVKVRRGLSPSYVADRLEDLIASLREKEFGFWGGVPEDLPGYLLRAAEEDARRLKIGTAQTPVRVIIDRPDEEGVLYRIDIVGTEEEAEEAADEEPPS